jgi:hypothetical protein
VRVPLHTEARSAALLCLAEQEELKRLLPEMVRFEPTWEELELYKDGGIAIIDQWICSHARCCRPAPHQMLIPRYAYPPAHPATPCPPCPPCPTHPGDLTPQALSIHCGPVSVLGFASVTVGSAFPQLWTVLHSDLTCAQPP